jgi:hypothetical protein
MYFGSVTQLLKAIGRDHHLRTEVTRCCDPRCGDEWIITARSEEGEIWRSRHSNLLLGVVMLERMLNGVHELVPSRV